MIAFNLALTPILKSINNFDILSGFRTHLVKKCQYKFWARLKVRVQQKIISLHCINTNKVCKHNILSISELTDDTIDQFTEFNVICTHVLKKEVR